LASVGEHSEGLWQINVGSDVRQNSWGNLDNPLINARAAYQISNGGTDMRPWTTTHTDGGTWAKYMDYLPEVEKVTGYQGDGRGVDGYDSPLNPPLPTTGTSVGTADYGSSGGTDLQGTTTASSQYDAIDFGQPPGGDKDSDGDGLSDALEKALGLNPHLSDSDHDGVSDGLEVAVYHTNPLVADTDHDGVS